MIEPAAGLAAAAAVSALLAIVADEPRRRRPFYLLKPLTSLLIVALALLLPAHTPPEYRLWIVAALLACTLGDIALMFTGTGWSLAGLSSFLVGHGLFIGAFVQGVGDFALPWWSLFWLAVLPVMVFIVPRTGTLKIPVLVYMSVIGGMALAALARYHALGTPQALLALIGATLFMMSDSALAVRQFTGPYRGAQPLILSTYWLAIGLIAFSI